MNPETNALGGALLALNVHEWNKDLVGNTSPEGFRLNKAFDTLPKTEIRAAEIIAAKFKGYLSYNPDKSQWYMWDGRIHRPCVGNGLVKKAVTEFYKQHSQAINEIETFNRNKKNDIADEDRVRNNARLKDYKKFRDSISKASGLSALVRLLEHMLDVAADHYADDTRWFVVENGVYDMDAVRKTKEFKLLPHDRNRPVYRAFNLIEEAGATHPALDIFTSQSIEDEGQARFFQKIMGTALMGITPEVRSVVSIQGKPSSGKSMILRILKAFGPSFIATPQRDAVVLHTRTPQHARYPMKDARVSGFTEITDKLNREFLLQYSGMDEVRAEDKYIKNEDWMPQGVIFMFSNHGMNIDKTDQAVYDRIKPINFPHTFQRASPTGHELLPGLQQDIEEQRAGFLEWIKTGFLMGLEDGFDCTDSMESLKRGERDSDDPVSVYLSDRMAADVFWENFDAPESHCVTVSELYRDYKMWHRHSGSGKELARQDVVNLLERKYEKSSTGAKKFKGLVKNPQLFVDGSFIG